MQHLLYNTFHHSCSQMQAFTVINLELIQESVAYKIIWTIIHLNIFKNVHQQLWYSNEVYSHVKLTYKWIPHHSLIIDYQVFIKINEKINPAPIYANNSDSPLNQTQITSSGN